MTYHNDNDYLAHHGIKGQRWGVKNGPPYPLSEWSASEKKYKYRAIRADKTRKDVDSIINSLNSDERDKVLAGSDHYLNLEEGSNVVVRSLKKIGDKPISFFDVLEDDNNELQVALATRSGDEYRGKGYGYKTAKKGMDWIESHREDFLDKTVIWGVRTDNEGSIRIAKKLGFEMDKSSYSDDKRWVNYTKKIK